MKILIQEDVEAYARTLRTCPGCGQPKEVGLIVCWDCFKDRKDLPAGVPPFKWWASSSLNSWLRAIGRPLLDPEEAKPFAAEGFRE